MSPLTSIAVFGRSDALWPVATLLEQALPDRIALVLVEDISVEVPPGAATLACDNPFFEQVGLNASDLVRDGNAMLGLGTDCQGWQGDGSSFFVAPSGTLPAINDIALHHIMLRAAMMQNTPERLGYLFQPFRFAARVALAGKFADRTDDPNSPLRVLGPTVQFDRAALGALLKGCIPKDGAQCHEGQPAHVTMGDDGHDIRSVQLGDGQEIAADLFVDVSGTLSLLAQGGEELRTYSLADILPFDRIARRFDTGRGSADHLHTVARALQGGFRVETPLQDGVVSELLFSSADMEQEGPSFSFEPGFPENPWTGNLARLGSAAAQLGPYQSADMMLFLEQARHLVRAIPAALSMDIEATEFNRNQLRSARQIADFLALPFILNGRDETLWTDIRNAAPPEQLQIRLEQFKSRGRFVEFDHELFERQSWIETMIGFGITPERYDPSAAYLDMKRLPPILKAMVDSFTRAIEAMPEHSVYMKDMAAAADAPE
jgi:tryptophan 7-halogenase